MSLYLHLDAMRGVSVYDVNITHNLAPMAKAAGLYWVCWRPNEIGIETADEMVEQLEHGLAQLKAEPAKFRALNPENGWGSYEGLVRFVEELLAACRANPDAIPRACR